MEDNQFAVIEITEKSNKIRYVHMTYIKAEEKAKKLAEQKNGLYTVAKGLKGIKFYCQHLSNSQIKSEIGQLIETQTKSEMKQKIKAQIEEVEELNKLIKRKHSH